MEDMKMVVHNKKADAEGEHDDDVQLTFLVLGGMTMTGAITWMKPAFDAEQWRAWVFLLLNLVLLAIVFSSNKTNAHKKEANEIVTSSGPKCDSFQPDHEIDTEQQLQNKEQEQERNRPGCTDGHKNEDDELNERVEAFIVMFRQHLVADAKTSSSRK